MKKYRKTVIEEKKYADLNCPNCHAPVYKPNAVLWALDKLASKRMKNG